MKALRTYLGLALAVIVCFSLSDTTPPANAAFSDVAPGSWYEDAVTQLSQAGVLTGYSDGTFRPDQPVSAAEFVTIAARLANLPGARGQTTHWAAGQMQAALQAGWYDWDEIPPTGERFDIPITRQLAVKVLMRALLPEARGDYVTESAKIRDFSSLDGRYYEAVLAAYASGVVHGDPDGAFRPLDSLSRAEVCVLFQSAGAKRAGRPPASSPPVPEPVHARQGGVSQVWLDFLEARGISWCNWSLCDKNETSAALRPGTSPEGPWGQEELTESGRFVFSRFSQ